MNTIGIVCEYNPYHNGHLYHIAESRKELGGDSTVVCVMSGDFVQRGDAAYFTRFARAEAACRSGADIVLELPLPWCLSSAERFAMGAVSILDRFGCTHLSFGSECGDAETLESLAECIMSTETKRRIDGLLHADSSLPFAAARQRTAAECVGETAAALLTEPNNILAVEYIKAIKALLSDMKPFTVRRSGSGHDKCGDGELRSASELRGILASGGDISGFVPDEAMGVYSREIKAGRVRNETVLETAILSRLRMLPRESFDSLPDSGGGAGMRLYKAVRAESDIEDIARAASTKRYTVSRMRRMIYCAALGIEAECTKSVPPYTRLLALNKKGRDYISGNKDKISLPVVVRASDVHALDGFSRDVFAADASASDLFCLQFITNSDKKSGNSWRTGPVIV